MDYIHGADVVRSLAAQPNTVGFLLPAMGKEELFPTVIHTGCPQDPFSMGEAHDKRFYLGGPAHPGLTDEVILWRYRPLPS